MRARRRPPQEELIESGLLVETKSSRGRRRRGGEWKERQRKKFPNGKSNNRFESSACRPIELLQVIVALTWIFSRCVLLAPFNITPKSLLREYRKKEKKKEWIILTTLSQHISLIFPPIDSLWLGVDKVKWSTHRPSVVVVWSKKWNSSKNLFHIVCDSPRVVQCVRINSRKNRNEMKNIK